MKQLLLSGCVLLISVGSFAFNDTTSAYFRDEEVRSEMIGETDLTYAWSAFAGAGLGLLASNTQAALATRGSRINDRGWHAGWAVAGTAATLLGSSMTIVYGGVAKNVSASVAAGVSLLAGGIATAVSAWTQTVILAVGCKCNGCAPYLASAVANYILAIGETGASLYLLTR